MFGSNEKTIRIELELKDGDELTGDDFPYTAEKESAYMEVAGLVGNPQLHNLKMIIDGDATFVPANEIKLARVIIQE